MTLSLIRFLPASRTTWSRETDVVIVGSGAAGLSAALEATRHGLRVIVLCKGELGGGATPLAQGGLAAVMDPQDSFDLHVTDTLVAGAGLAEEQPVRELVTAAPGAIGRLVDLGAHFDSGSLGLEGGHSRHRIVHAGGDASGLEVHRALRHAVAMAGIEVLERTVAVDALSNDAGAVVGIVTGRIDAAHPENRLDVGIIHARSVVLATGGLGQAYATSSNPIEATGDGLALAARAGAELADLEFVQFHPTVMYLPGHQGQCPLMTEALRGAGGTIIDANNTSIMAGQHPRGDLAPRDVVALAMQRAMNVREKPSTNLWLDVRSLGSRRLEFEFPTTTSFCRAYGIDPAREPIPVAPGAHYSCGGVLADMDGRTTVTGLYAIGEVASTGVHGANRLASNSLTEALITGRRLGRLLGNDRGSAPSSLSDMVHPLAGAGVRPDSRGQYARAMSMHAGVLRTREGLQVLQDLLADAPSAPSQPLDLAVLEATNLHAVAALISTGALVREESRGCHRRDDFPQSSTDWEQRIKLRVHEGEIVATIGVPA